MNDSTNSDTTQKSKFDLPESLLERIDIIAHWVVLLWAIPVSFFSAILAQFVQRGGSGARILSGLAFWIGTVFATDGIWQTFFRGVPLFPWFEDTWIGWRGWLTLPVNIFFWISLVISYLIQTEEAKTLRSKTPAVAKLQYENAAQYNLSRPKSFAITHRKIPIKLSIVKKTVFLDTFFGKTLEQV
jgi:hypothetical protein